LAVPPYCAAERLVALRDRAGADRAPAEMMHDEIGIGADHWQGAKPRGLQHFFVALDIFIPAPGAGVMDELRRADIVDAFEAEPVEHVALARRRDVIAD